MDSRDIKIGNYLLTSYSYLCEVELIHKNHFDCRELTTGLFVTNGEYKPVPLTPDWAEILGFKYFKSRCGKNTRTWYLNHFFIYFGKKNGPKMNDKFPLPYVHNLQNLWWERFKTPLEIKQIGMNPLTFKN